MKITKIEVGYLKTNCYILENNNKVLIIDPGDEYIKIKKEIGNKQVVGCLITHRHFDHIGALEEILKEYHLKVNDYQGKDFVYNTLVTKGHTEDSVTYYFEKEKIMFCGDFLFYHGIGRTDLGGNINDMKESLKYISTFDDDIKLFPGHGPETTLKEEKTQFKFYF